MQREYTDQVDRLNVAICHYDSAYQKLPRPLTVAGLETVAVPLAQANLEFAEALGQYDWPDWMVAREVHTLVTQTMAFVSNLDALPEQSQQTLGTWQAKSDALAAKSLDAAEAVRRDLALPPAPSCTALSA